MGVGKAKQSEGSPEKTFRVPHSRLVALSLALITLFAYAPVTLHSFVNLDDDLYVADNPVVQQGFTWEGVKWAFTTWRGSMWHPVTWLSHMLDCELFGVNAGAHHLVSVLFHCANVTLVFLLLLKLTRAVWPSSLVAALFALHPFFVESVAWIAERQILLSLLFGLLALHFYAGYAQTRSKQNTEPIRGPRSRGYLFALFFFALSLMAKPMFVTLPLVMLLLDYWPLQRLADFSFRPVLSLAREKWPFFLLIVPVCVVTFLAEQHDKLVTPLETLPLSPRLCNAVRSYALYLWKTVCPAKLCSLYPFPPRDQLALSGLAAGAVLVLITLLIWRERRTCPYLLVGWLWFLGTLVPVIGVVQIGYQAMNDHHAYGPLIGIFIAAAFGLRHLMARLKVSPIRLGAGAGLVLCACLVASRHQLGYWRDDQTLFTRALEVTTENGPAHNNLGIWFAKQGRQSEALAHFREAVRLNPLWADPHNNLGELLRSTDNPREALVELGRAVQLKPRQPTMRNNLGELLGDLGRFDEAMMQLNEAARLDPRYASPHFQMARLFLQGGYNSDAVEQCRVALCLDPNNALILRFTAHILAANQTPELRDGETALTLASRACGLVRGDADNLDVLAMALAETGDFTNAQKVASRVLELTLPTEEDTLQPRKQRWELYQKQQPWRESFALTNNAFWRLPCNRCPLRYSSPNQPAS